MGQDRILCYSGARGGHGGQGYGGKSLFGCQDQFSMIFVSKGISVMSVSAVSASYDPYESEVRHNPIVDFFD